MEEFKIGSSYCFFIPPGWIIVGCVQRVTEKAVFLEHGFHLENVADNVSALAIGLTPDVSKAVTKSYPLPPGGRLDINGILIAVPCEMDITKLSYAHIANAIKGKR
jgi:hypothetical protein